MPNLDKLTQNQIIELLKNNPSHISSDIPLDINQHKSNYEYKKASVLIPFIKKENNWHIVFIRRAESDRDRHSGQVAFVGGKAESYDKSEIDTALRETQEEIGVNPKDVIVLGQLGFHYSVSNFEITPIVGTIPWPYNFKTDPAEVSHVFTLPLNWLADEKNYEIRYRQPLESDHQIPVVYFNKYDGELLWGATARMILSLISTLKAQ